MLLHGFTQTRVSWDPVVAALGSDVEVLRPDLPGHGAAADLRADLGATADAVATVGGRATYVGYSMGGRVALRMALDHPEVVDRLVLIGATAGIDDPGERAARRTADEALAHRIEVDGVAAFVDRWLAQPLFAGLEVTDVDRAVRRAGSPAGLAASLRLAGTGTMDPPWWEELAALGRAAMPVDVVVGERDAKFASLGRRLVEGIGSSATLHVVAGAGHACHLERPAEVAALLTRR